jgi:ribosomal protein S18 acetylase RimI-like enzyme
MPAELQPRLLSAQDVALIERLLRVSEYIYQRFTLAELPSLLQHYPAVGLFRGNSLHAFLLSQAVHSPSAWIAGFGVSWSESRAYINVLSTLLDNLIPSLLERGVRYLYYSGNDSESDWLRTILLSRGFIPYRRLYSYDKYDYTIPSSGNQQVRVRPVDLKRDLAALLVIEDACFEDLWRYDAISFADITATHPYFVVAELQGHVVGYQFNAVDDDNGYLIRVAVHPSASGQGIGVRLMAEATRFFQQARVTKILLNTQEDNTHAHRLYEWFGFVRVPQQGFALRKRL